jgi:hypothetical protein
MSARMMKLIESDLAREGKRLSDTKVCMILTEGSELRCRIESIDIANGSMKVTHEQSRTRGYVMMAHVIAVQIAPEDDHG